MSTYDDDPPRRRKKRTNPIFLLSLLAISAITLFATAWLVGGASFSDPRNLALFAIVVLITAVGLLEVKYLQTKRLEREQKGGMEDESHNALITAKSIARTLERGGIRSAEALRLIAEAERAGERGNHRVVLELCERAKAVMMQAKARGRTDERPLLSEEENTPTTGGSAPSGSSDEAVTAKEMLARKFPAGYLQAKFSLGVAQEALESARRAGQDVTQTQRLLAKGQESFDARDYTTALRYGLQAQRSLGGGLATIPAEETTGPEIILEVIKCPSCGANTETDDQFCRRCGNPLRVRRTCPGCGAEPRDDDAFCRRCGTKLS